MVGTVDFYFDFSSPYSYFAALRIDAVAARRDVRVAWRPILLGAAFKLTGMVPLVAVPLKGAYMLQDLARLARHHDLPFRMPDRFPFAGTLPARAFHAIAETDRAAAERFAQAAYRRAFGAGLPIDDADSLAPVLTSLGHDAVAVLERAVAPEIKDRLRQEVDQAIARGVFGSPFFIVGDEAFWGHDRLDEVERWIATGGW